MDLALASEGGCFWAFHLEPLIRAASTVRRAKPLGHDAFAPERAVVLVDHRAVAVIGRIEPDPVVPFEQCPSEMLFAFLNGSCGR